MTDLDDFNALKDCAGFILACAGFFVFAVGLLEMIGGVK